MRLAFCLLLAMVVPVFAGKNDSFFPLEKGMFWIYRGDVSFLEKNPATQENEVKTRTLTWEMEVVDTVSTGKYLGALVKGMPQDLAWYETNKPRGDYLILREGSRKYSLLAGEDAMAVFAALKKGAVNKERIENGENLLELPLTEGKTFGGDRESMVRQRNCWVVDDVSPWQDDPDIKGVPRGVKTVIHLSYHSNPSHIFLEFAPGLGIVGYTYGHHGTTSECGMRLIEFGKADRKASQQKKTQ